AEWVGWNLSWFHSPAPVEDFLGCPARTPSDPRRRQVVERPQYAVGNALGQKLGVPRVRLALEGARRGRRRVRVGRCDKDLARGKSALFLHDALGRVENGS